VRTDAVADRSFEQGSPVCSYWLAHCERFAVRAGRRSGVVERVQLDESLRPQELVVRFALTRSVVPADRVRAVVPANELLMLETRPAQVRPALRRFGETALRTPRRATSAAYRGTAGAGRTIAPHAARAGRVTARGALAAAAWTAVGLALAVQFAHTRGRAAAVVAVRWGESLSAAALASMAERRARRAPHRARVRRRNETRTRAGS
jgi:hypothetical protein